MRLFSAFVLASLISTSVFGASWEAYPEHAEFDGVEFTFVVKTSGRGHPSMRDAELELAIKAETLASSLKRLTLQFNEIRPDGDMSVEQSAVSHCYRVSLGELAATAGVEAFPLAVVMPAVFSRIGPIPATAMCNEYMAPKMVVNGAPR